MSSSGSVHSHFVRGLSTHYLNRLGSVCGSKVFPNYTDKATYPLTSLSGMFAVYKPRGLRSANMLNKIKQKLLQNSDGKMHKKMLKLGHGGTLDELAEGVLVIGVGDATKQLSSILFGNKVYQATIRFGMTSDSFDLGTPIKLSNPTSVVPPFDVQDLEELLQQQFVGSRSQAPPVYSSLKVQGHLASHLARSGQEVELKPRITHLHYAHVSSLITGSDRFKPELVNTHLNWPDVQLDLEVGGGYYVRSLCNDIGNHYGVGAVLVKLVRVLNGSFSVDHPLTLRLEEINEESVRTVLSLPFEKRLSKSLTIPRDVWKSFSSQIPSDVFQVDEQENSSLLWISRKQSNQDNSVSSSTGT